MQARGDEFNDSHVSWLQLEAQARAEGKDPPSRGTSKCDCTSTHGLQNHTDTEPVEPPTCVAKMLPRMAKLLPAITAEELRANPISVAIEKVRGTARKRAARARGWGRAGERIEAAPPAGRLGRWRAPPGAAGVSPADRVPSSAGLRASLCA